MTLDEAIAHAKEVFENQSVCEDCREEHKQLAEWLEELKQNKGKECKANAREMFEKLGYTIRDENYIAITYYKINGEFYESINFNKVCKFFDAEEFDASEEDAESKNISMGELQAINKQCKELWWL